MNMQEAIQFSEKLSSVHLAFLKVRDILQREKACLAINNPLELTEIATEKNKLLSEATVLLNPIGHLLNAKEADTHFQQQITGLSLPDQERLTKIWQDVLNLIREIKTQNSINGTVIAINLNNIQRLLHLLRTGDSSVETYDKKGKAKHTIVDKDFIEA